MTGKVRVMTEGKFGGEIDEPQTPRWGRACVVRAASLPQLAGEFLYSTSLKGDAVRKGTRKLFRTGRARGAPTGAVLKSRLSPTAFGNQTVSASFSAAVKRRAGVSETHGFASLPRGRFALIVYNRRLAKDRAGWDCCPSGSPLALNRF